MNPLRALQAGVATGSPVTLAPEDAAALLRILDEQRFRAANRDLEDLELAAAMEARATEQSLGFDEELPPGPRPAGFESGRVKVRPVRPRGARGPQDGRWYWRGVVYEGSAERTVWTGWATAGEAAWAIHELPVAPTGTPG